VITVPRLKSNAFNKEFKDKRFERKLAHVKGKKQK